MKTLRIIAIFLVLSFSLQAQMQIDGDTLYGNEWINYDQSYYKITITEDGFYKLGYQELVDAGVFSGPNVQGANFQLFHHGKEVPIQVSEQGTFGTGDYIAFYGEKNRGWLDRFIYIEPSYHTNPEYSLFIDTSSYFLTYNTVTNNERFDFTANDLANTPSVEPYCWAEELNVYFNLVAGGIYRTGTHGSWYSGYDIGEGFAKSYAKTQTINVSTPNAYTAGPGAVVSARYKTPDTNISHHLNLSVNGTMYVDTSFQGTVAAQHNINIPASSLSATTAVTFDGLVNADDKYGVCFVRVKYPRELNFGGASSFDFSVAASSGKKYLEISNFSSGGTAPVLYDKTNNIVITTTLENNLVKVTLPASATERELTLVSDAGYKSIVKIEDRPFVDYSLTPANYIMISHPRLRGNGSDPDYVQQYADYRSTPQGGDFDVLLADIEEIYDQFGYGVKRHEISARNFIHYAIKNIGAEYLFIIGKGASFDRIRPANSSWHDLFFVPPFGIPQSDNMIAAFNDSSVPLVPVGRIAAKNTEQVKIYLDKVIDHETTYNNATQTIEDKAWMKNIIHLGGGDAAIQSLIQNRLSNVQEIIENGTYGAKVYPFYKTSTDVIQEAPSEQISALINNGVSMITFFGHSAPSTLDYDLEEPSNYNNFGKYPLIYAIGCNTNRYFEFDGTLSEKWVFEKDKGAIAFLGASWVTNLSPLADYANFFYENMATTKYGERMGDVMKQTIEDVSSNSSFIAEQLRQVIILHGDPALKLNTHEGPDLLVNEPTVSISPALINNQMEDFDFSFTVTNIGARVSDTMSILITHELPNGQQDSVTVLRAVAPGYESSFTLSVPLTDKDVIGFNKIKVTIDPQDSIPELPNPLAELNNDYVYSFYIIANDAFPVYPYDYSIVNSPDITLKASTANAFAETQKYYMEIDTSGYFNSPLKMETILSAPGGVLKWKPNMAYTDNTVYYWRISIDSTETTGFGFNWHESSFVYKEDSSPGWNQSHFHQMKRENKLDGVNLEEPLRELAYNEKFSELKMKIGPWPIVQGFEFGPLLNGGLVQQFHGCSPAGLHVMVFDSCTLQPLENPVGGLYESYNCRPEPLYAFPYKTNDVIEREKLINFLVNVIPPKSYVAIYSNQNTGSLSNTNNYYYYPEDWAMDSVNNSYQKNIFQVLEEQGATRVRELEQKGSVPYFFLYQKDNPTFLAEQNYATEGVADSLLMKLEEPYIISTPLSEGEISSVEIGPALFWNALEWNMKSYDENFDKFNLQLFGIDNQNNETLLHDHMTAFDTTLAHINAQQYPYMRLAFTIKDSLLKSSPHLDFWRILYDPAPEAALRPDINLAFNNDTIQQGEELSIDIAVENISEHDMDSVLVHYTVIDQNNTAFLTETRMEPLLKGDTIRARLNFDTRALSTPVNQLLIDVNPNKDQGEQYHFNNVGIKPFYVKLDERNPLLDVTFDGVHILDGDLVSAEPMISIAALDENKYLAMNDTSNFRVSFKGPEDSDFKRITFADQTVQFFPAEENNLNKENKARIEIRRKFEVDGIYELKISAEDRTGNDAGDYDYITRFEVINEQLVSNVFNYPNPFSTSTQFVFTLTGGEVPDFMKIQIMTVSGKVVREITQDELGPIHVGKNLTDYRWDGTDEYGDRLGNGVYIYRVVTRKADGEMYEKYDTKTDQYFNHGLGKMVIIR
jgi:hypothetical protein